MGRQKCALVTGGSRGIGAGIARTLAKAGYDVAITFSKSASEGEAVRDEIIRSFGRRCVLIQATLQEREAPDITVKASIRALGHIDVLVNNAGACYTESILEVQDETFDLLCGLDFRSYVMCARTAARHMVKHGIKGSIISITSTRAGRAYEEDGVYGGVKAAMNRATESFALDLAPYGIRVNAVAPGATQIRFPARGLYGRFCRSMKDRVPLARLGTPGDIGEAVLFLADNERSSYITGVVLKVDGGLTLSGMPEHPDAPKWTHGKIEKTWDDAEL